MRLILMSLIGLVAFSSIASASSYTMRYFTGTSVAQIAPLKDERTCHKLAKQKGLNHKQYYCLETGDKWNYNLERELGWS